MTSDGGANSHGRGGREEVRRAFVEIKLVRTCDLPATCASSTQFRIESAGSNPPTFAHAEMTVEYVRRHISVTVPHKKLQVIQNSARSAVPARLLCARQFMTDEKLPK